MQIKSIGMPFGIPMLLLLLGGLTTACSGSKLDVTANNLKLDTIYMMRTKEVNTLVSDSGLLQYRLKSPEWRIYNQGDHPRWYFPHGIYLEKFDERFKPLATVKADTAYYYTNEDLWELIGHVHIHNLQGTQFFAPRMFWNKATGRIYSHDSVYIISPDRALHGESFEASQDMKQYRFTNTTGDMMYSEEKENTSSLSDSVIPAEPVRQQGDAPLGQGAAKPAEPHRFRRSAPLPAFRSETDKRVSSNLHTGERKK